MKVVARHFRWQLQSGSPSAHPPASLSTARPAMRIATNRPRQGTPKCKLVTAGIIVKMSSHRLQAMCVRPKGESECLCIPDGRLSVTNPSGTTSARRQASQRTAPMLSFPVWALGQLQRRQRISKEMARSGSSIMIVAAWPPKRRHATASGNRRSHANDDHQYDE